MTSTEASSFVIPSPNPDSSPHDDDVASLASDDSGETGTTMSGPLMSDAEREWRESLQQLELLLTMVLVPYMGKYFGRKAAYWVWAKVMTWKYPVQIVVTDPTFFKAAGIIGAVTPGL